MATLFAAEAAKVVSEVASEHCTPPLEALGTAIAQAVEVVQSGLVRAGWPAINPGAENPDALATALETALSNVRGALGQSASNTDSGGDSSFNGALKGKLQALANGALNSLDPLDGAGGSAGASPMQEDDDESRGAAASSHPEAPLFARAREAAQERKRKREDSSDSEEERAEEHVGEQAEEQANETNGAGVGEGSQ